MTLAGCVLVVGKRLVQEGLALAGRLMIGFGVCEKWLSLLALRAAQRDAAPVPLALAIYRPDA